MNHENEKMVMELRNAGEILIKKAKDIVGELDGLHQIYISITIEANKATEIDVNKNHYYGLRNNTLYVKEKDDE